MTQANKVVAVMKVSTEAIRVQQISTGERIEIWHRKFGGRGLAQRVRVARIVGIRGLMAAESAQRDLIKNRTPGRYVFDVTKAEHGNFTNQFALRHELPENSVPTTPRVVDREQ